MIRNLIVATVVAAALVVSTTSANAQARATVSGAELDAAVTAPSNGDQAVVQNWLQTGRVADAARSLGVSASDLSARVATLDQATLSDLANRARADERQLAGGNTVVISTTAIIIILLILILLLK